MGSLLYLSCIVSIQWYLVLAVVMVSLSLVRGMMHPEVYNAVVKILEKISIPIPPFILMYK